MSNSRRRSVRYSFDLSIMGAEFHLRGVRKHSLDCWRVLRIEARGYRDRFGGGYSNWKESAQEPGDVDARSAGLCRDLLFKGAIPRDCSQCGTDRILRRFVVAEPIHQR